MVAADSKSLRPRYSEVVEHITQIGPMHQALVRFMDRAAEKVRGEGMCCHHVTLFLSGPACSATGSPITATCEHQAGNAHP